MADIAVLTPDENGANSLIDINANFAALNTAITPQLPEEAVDGSRTVFTFSTLTSQPRFVVSDNAQMQAVTSRGNVNWTWNQSTLQVTMMVTPQDDLCALP
jgi:hypothetical protein